jgi:hypothetical protein
MNSFQKEVLDDLIRRKSASRGYLRSLPPLKKIELMFRLQDQYFQFLDAREKNGGEPIPERWRKWIRARKGISL